MTGTIALGPVSIPSHAGDGFVCWTGPIPDLRHPILIAAFEGWNDAGDAATTAARHFADRLKAEVTAEIDPEPFFDFTATRPQVRLDENRIRSLIWPTNVFRAASVSDADHDIVVLIGIEPQLRWRTFSEQVIATARALGVVRIVTLGALLAEVPHSRPIEVFGTTDDDRLRVELNFSPSTYEGPTGIVGVLSTACRDAGFPTVSLWSAVPSYVPAAPSPKAALALVERVCVMTEIGIRFTDLEQSVATYEGEVNRLVAEDGETAEYVAGLERAWDENRGQGLNDDPETLVAEVERFLRDNKRGG